MNLLNDFQAMAKKIAPCNQGCNLKDGSHHHDCYANLQGEIAAALAKIAQNTYEKVKDETRRYFQTGIGK